MIIERKMSSKSGTCKIFEPIVGFYVLLSNFCLGLEWLNLNEVNLDQIL